MQQRRGGVIPRPCCQISEEAARPLLMAYSEARSVLETEKGWWLPPAPLPEEQDEGKSQSSSPGLLSPLPLQHHLWAELNKRPAGRKDGLGRRRLRCSARRPGVSWTAGKIHEHDPSRRKIKRTELCGQILQENRPHPRTETAS